MLNVAAPPTATRVCAGVDGDAMLLRPLPLLYVCGNLCRLGFLRCWVSLRIVRVSRSEILEMIWMLEPLPAQTELRPVDPLVMLGRPAAWVTGRVGDKICN